MLSYAGTHRIPAVRTQQQPQVFHQATGNRQTRSENWYAASGGDFAAEKDTQSMAKYRKKPVVIDTVQFNQLGDHPAVVADENSPTGFGIPREVL